MRGSGENRSLRVSKHFDTLSSKRRRLSEELQPAAAHSLRSHVCGLRSEISAAHVPGNFRFHGVRHLRMTERREALRSQPLKFAFFDRLGGAVKTAPFLS